MKYTSGFGLATLFCVLFCCARIKKTSLLGSCANNFLAFLMASFWLTCFFYSRECLSRERAQLEENSEKRLEIFKELVNSYTKSADEISKLQDRPCSEQAGRLVFFSICPKCPFY